MLFTIKGVKKPMTISATKMAKIKIINEPKTVTIIEKMEELKMYLNITSKMEEPA